MVETPGTAAEAQSAGPQPVRLTIDQITFKNDNLWQPLYGSLFRYDHVPGLQLEPAFQLRTSARLDLEITFVIAEGQEVTFVQEGEGRVKCRSLDAPGSPDVPGLAEARWVDARTCTLVWRQSDANRAGRRRVPEESDRRMALRIFCQGGKAPGNDWERAAAEVEGGLYLAVLYRPPAPPTSAIPRPPIDKILGNQEPEEPVRLLLADGSEKRAKIRVVRIDREYRPVFDVFLPAHESIPRELALEPAFRAREGQAVELDMILGVPRVQWMTEKGEVMVTPFATESRPRQLQTTSVSADGKTCQVRWVQQTGRGGICRTGAADAARSYCTVGYVSAFDFTAIPSPELVDDLRERMPGLINSLLDPLDLFADVAIDPTVIEPPACTPEGICVPPDGGGGGPRTT